MGAQEARTVSSETQIHPTAVVDPRAKLGPGVIVGPYAVVGPDVTLDVGVEVGPHVVLEGLIVMGAGAKVGPGSVLGGAPQDLKYRPGTPSGLRIGAGTVIREHVTIHRATHADSWTEIGTNCLIMAMSHIAHDCRVGDGVIVINYAGIPGHCEIGERATIGGLTGLVPFTRIGCYAYVGGCSKVVSDVPPFVLVDGRPVTARSINVIGLRRAGIAAEDRRALQDAFHILYRSALAPQRALERIRAELPLGGVVGVLVDFVAASRRGICGPGRAGAGENGEEMDAESERIF